MNPVLEKLKKQCRVKEADVLSKSKIFKVKDPIQTKIPILNLALGGSINSGLRAGVTVFAGPSKHFKSMFSLILAGAYLKAKPNAALLFYDSEFGMPVKYFESCGIDADRVLHVPVKNIEELKFDIVNQLENLTEADEVVILIDSLGNIASKKEVDDAIKENSAADMTRAKALKSLFRMVTPYLTLKDIPLIGVQHTYQSQGMFPTDVVAGGTGSVYSANTLFIVGRQQEKEGTDIVGYNFILKVEKSRFVKEKSKLAVCVTWAGGVEKWSGFLAEALDGGYVVKPKNGWYSPYDPVKKAPLADKAFREAQTYNDDFWNLILENTDFADYLEKKFSVGMVNMINEDTDEEIEDED